MAKVDQRASAVQDDLLWTKLSKRLVKSLPRDSLHSQTIQFIERLKIDEPLAIACSGGADSIFLLLSIAGFFPERRKHLNVLHFNHCLRRKASDEDKSFTEAVVKGLGISFVSEEWKHCSDKSVNEAQAREARHDFFLRAMRCFSSTVLLLGHHQNDVAETMLMRIAQGSGARGLAAPRPIQYFSNGFTYLRPLLHLKKEKIVTHLEALSIPWREDQSNHKDDFFRNRIRHNVIPAWNQSSPQDIFTGAVRSRVILEEEDAAIEEWLDTLLPIDWQKNSCDLSLLKSKPKALLRRAIHRWLGANHLQYHLSSRAFDQLMQAFSGYADYKWSVGDKGFITLKEGIFRWIYEDETEVIFAPLLVPVDTSLFLPNGNELKSEVVHLNDDYKKNILNGKVNTHQEAWLDLNALKGEKNAEILLIKRWESGDAYIPLGAPGKSKLQDCFTNRKILQKERAQLPVVCNHNGDILWAPGLLPCENFKINFSTDYALRLTYC